MSRRIHWVDVAKCFGIFAIYLGHCGEAAGDALHFVHTHHVALFFLLSGCMENFNRECGIWKTVQKVCKRILLPWLVFCLLFVLANLGNRQYLQNQIPEILRGTIRGRFDAGGLWFLTCLAVIQILFSVLRKLKYKPLILLAAACMYYYVQMTRVPSPLIWGTLQFNLDSALCYILFYVIGYLVFPYADRGLNPVTRRGKLLLGISGAISLVYAVLVFVNRDPLQTTLADKYVFATQYALMVHPVLRALILIWLYFVAAKLLENGKLLRDIGVNTLYLCGGEYIVKTLPARIMSLVGIRLYPYSLITSLVYTAGMLILAFVTVVPVEKWLLAKIENGIGRLCLKHEKTCQ